MSLSFIPTDDQSNVYNQQDLPIQKPHLSL